MPPTHREFCTAEDEARDLGCSLPAPHKPPHRDLTDPDNPVEFASPDQYPEDYAAEAVAAHPDLPAELTSGLTMYAPVCSAQIRLETTLATNDDGTLVEVDGHLQPGPTLTSLYLSISPDVYVTENDHQLARLTAVDARNLRDLLNIATARGVL